MICRFTAATFACLFAALLLVGTAHSQGQQVVKNASVQFSTGEDGKDNTTGFTVTVTNAGGKILERVFEDRRKAQPGTISTFWLNRTRAETAEKLKGSHITITILPRGEERWTIKDARLKVNFVSGPSRSWHWGPFTLQSSDGKPASVDFVLDDDGL